MFGKTIEFIKESKYPASDEQKLQLYAYFKQAFFGDCNVPKPGMLDFVGKAKWESWNNIKGTTQAAAMQRYIATAVKVDPTIQKKMAAEYQDEEYEEGDKPAALPKQ
jgi:diazepam-binding inhibitor (GABA receptor modulator, acyl-CoA-binding protein)